ncbi:PREDICTED: claspin-like [Amphimedon queenslandica]|uniref:Uncharacterized protein n=1 Tax=Amphimedon queenslandica TaxID=400682 RepID=A0A1X7SRT9_AMPQE|nr:PREDICTED: claspin-like [Amphimedon queenslandica]|eukprot:XP_019862990.1 PREDICTED: claspin-like [Amphimedon queenslandica]
MMMRKKWAETRMRRRKGRGPTCPYQRESYWDQVNKVHMKQLADDDKADLRNIKDRFLLEGDLCEDGLYLKNGFFRSRRFAPKRTGSETSLDMFLETERDFELGEGEGDDDSQIEAKKRRDRLERDEFIRKSQARSDLLTFDDNSQSILNLINDNSPLAVPQTPEVKTAIEPLSLSAKRSRCGSFLKHTPSTLQRLSSYTNTTPAATGGRSFVFRSGVTAGTPSSTKSNGPKRPKLLKSISLPHEDRGPGSNSNSIFDEL